MRCEVVSQNHDIHVFSIFSNNRKYLSTVSIQVLHQMQLVIIRRKASVFQNIQQIVPFIIELKSK
jgi:hypothetical protein